jgi:hypothetical protein
LNKRIQAFNHMKKDYQNTNSPSQLDSVIRKAIQDGQRDRVRSPQGTTYPRTSKRYLRLAYAAAAAFLIFVGSLNAFPMFAAQLAEIPVLGQLVKILTFTEGRASGGNITDGTDVSGITIQTLDDVEQFTIHFNQDGQSQALAGAYNVVYAQNPETLQFEISGVRMLSAQADFESLKASALIKEVYPIVTLDDSTVRFMIVFEQPVKYEISEMKDPASLVLQVSADPDATAVSASQFRVRTLALPRGEGLAILEEMVMMDYPERRILPSNEEPSLFYIEIAQVASEEEATKLIEILRTSYPDLVLEVEAIGIDS